MINSKITTNVLPTAAWALFWCVLLTGYSTLSFAVTTDKVYLENDRLSYTSDADDNRLPDFSHAGYQGEAFNSDGTLNLLNLPAVPVGSGLSPLGGGADDAAQINAAIQALSGSGGVVQLEAGTFNIETQIVMDVENVVLRGRGKDTTILSGNVPFDSESISNNKSIILMGGGYTGKPWSLTSDGSDAVANITTPFIPVGSRSFEVDSTTGFSVGDNVIVVHPSTEEWLTSINWGDTADGSQWRIAGATYTGSNGGPNYEAGTLPTGPLGVEGSPRETIVYNRYIVAITDDDGDGLPGVVLDAPIFNHFDQTIYQAGSPAVKPYMYKHNDVGNNIIREMGVEDLAIEINTGLTAPADNAISMMKIEDGFVNNVRAEGFRVAAVLTRNGSRITVANTDALNPAGSFEGSGERDPFLTERGSNNILFFNCSADSARHAYISNGTTSSSGIVVLESTQTQTSLESGGHRKWVTGMLFDNLVSSQPSPGIFGKIALFSRAFGNHGWGSAHSVVWDSTVDSGNRIIIQKPPTAQNYCFGCEAGQVTDVSEFDTAARNALFGPGHIEATGDDMDIASLFREQLRVRQAYGVAPDGPARLTATEDNPGEITLTWMDVAQNETAYSVERSEDGGAFTEIQTLAANTESFTDTGASVGASVVYRVRATDDASGNKSAYANESAALTVSDPGNGGGNGGDEVFFVKVAVNDQGSISSSRGIEIEEIRVFDANGDNIARDSVGGSVADFSSDRTTRRRDYSASNAIDGSTSGTNGRWRTATRNEAESFIVIDLAGEAVDVSQVQVEWGGRYANDYRVELLDSTGNVIATQNGDASSRSIDDFNF